MSMFTSPHFAGARQPVQYVHQQEQSSGDAQASAQVSNQQIQYQQPAQPQTQPFERQPEVSRFPSSPSIQQAQQVQPSNGLNNYVASPQPASAQQEIGVTSPVTHHSTTAPQHQQQNATQPQSNHVVSHRPHQTLPPSIHGSSAEASHLANAYPSAANAYPSASTRTVQDDTATPPSKRSRGRPRKWAREEDRRAAEAQRRRDTNKAKKYGLPMPPRPVGTYQPPPGDGNDPNRGPYVYFDKDYGHHTPGTEGALTARDVIVNWLAKDGNWNRWNKWTVPERETVCRELQTVMSSHGMSEREILSIRQQVSFLQRGARDARRFEFEGPTTELSPFEQRRVAPLVNDHTTPHQALIRYRWPYYERLRAAVAEEPLLPGTISESHAHEEGTHDHDGGHLDIMDLNNINNSPKNAALANTTLGQALRSVEQWRGSQEPSEQELAEVTSRANQLLGNSSTPNGQGHSHRSTAGPALNPTSRVLTKREAEAWELEKLQIKQKLELEKEDRRAKEKISERELHLQSIKAFRELLKDGLTRNQAGSLVFAEDWQRIKAQWDDEAE